MSPCVNGHEVLAGDRFCGQCGRDVTATVEQPWASGGAGSPRVRRRHAARRPKWGPGARAGAVAAALLVLAAAGLGAYAGATGGPGDNDAVAGPLGASAAQRLPAVPASSQPAARSLTVPPSSTAAPPTGANTRPSSRAPGSRAVPGLSSLVGDWSGHGRGLHIGADGQGLATFRAYRFCTEDPTPPCDTMVGDAIVDGGHAQFALAPTSTAGTATGRVTNSNDPSAFQPGFVMTVTLTLGDIVVISSSPVAQSVAYCGSRATAGACGA